jgi:hypothetical protein
MSELVIGGTIAHRAIDVSRLRLSARDYSLDARGQIALDGALELRGDLELTPAASSSLADASGVLAGLAPAGRPMRIPISVAGRYPSLRVVPAINSVDGFLDRQDAGREPGRLLRRFLSGEGA